MLFSAPWPRCTGLRRTAQPRPRKARVRVCRHPVSSAGRKSARHGPIMARSDAYSRTAALRGNDAIATNRPMTPPGGSSPRNPATSTIALASAAHSGRQDAAHVSPIRHDLQEPRAPDPRHQGIRLLAATCATRPGACRMKLRTVHQHRRSVRWPRQQCTGRADCGSRVFGSSSASRFFLGMGAPAVTAAARRAVTV